MRIYVKSFPHLEVIEVEFDTGPVLEHLWLKVRLNKHTFVGVILYRPSHHSLKHCENVIVHPTTVTSTSSTLLDAIFTYNSNSYKT